MSSGRARPEFLRLSCDDRVNLTVDVILDAAANARVDPGDRVLILSLERVELVHVRGGREHRVHVAPEPRRETPREPAPLVAADEAIVRGGVGEADVQRLGPPPTLDVVG